MCTRSGSQGVIISTAGERSAKLSGVAQQKVIWQDGDPWRDLGLDVRAAGEATIISRHGATRFLDSELRRQCRHPGPSAHLMDFDAEWLPLGAWRLTPCGLSISHPDYWAQGTPLRLVLAGIVEDWASTEAGAVAWERVQDDIEPTAPGHPEEPCRAFWCARGNAIRLRTKILEQRQSEQRDN